MGFHKRVDGHWSCSLIGHQRCASVTSTDVNPIANRNSRGFQLADGGCDPAIGQVMTRVIVKPDDQNPGMMANGSHDQVMQVFEVLGIPSQYG